MVCSFFMFLYLFSLNTLSKLINATKPGLIDDKKIVMKKNPNAYEVMINHNLAIQGAIELGCTIVNIGSKDIYDGDVCSLWRLFLKFCSHPIFRQNLFWLLYGKSLRYESFDY